MSSASPTTQTTNPQAQAAQGRPSAGARRTEAPAQEESALFAHLLGLFTEPATSLTTPGESVFEASTEVQGADPSLPFVLGSGLTAGTEPALAAAGAHERLDELQRTGAGERLKSGSGMPSPGSLAQEEADRQGRLQNPEALRDAGGNAPGQPAGTNASPGLARGRGSPSPGGTTDRPTTLMLQGKDSISWGPSSASRPVLDGPAATALPLANSRSTVTLDQRFAPSRGAERSTASAAEGFAVGTGAGTGVAGASAHASSGQGAPSGGDGSGTGAGTSDSGSEDLGNVAEAAFELEAPEVREEPDLRGLTTAGLRQASLKVGQDGDEAIDIDISLRGQEVNVDFRTDSAEARQALQSLAGQALTDLLQRSGMQLAGMSVGGQSAGDRQEPGNSPPTRPRAEGRGSSTVSETTPQGLRRPDAGRGSSTLDLFV